MSELFEEAGLTASESQINQITRSFLSHMDSVSEQQSYGLIDRTDYKSQLDELKQQLKAIERERNKLVTERDAYVDNIKRYFNADEVKIEDGNLLVR